MPTRSWTEVTGLENILLLKLGIFLYMKACKPTQVLCNRDWMNFLYSNPISLMNMHHSVLGPADVIIAMSGVSFCEAPCNKSTFLSCQVKREQADMYWKCTGNIMIANCFEKKKVLWRTCHFNPCLWGSASAPSFVSPLRYMPSLTLDFGESSTCTVDQKQRINYKEEERPWTHIAPPPQKGAALFPPSSLF